VGSIADKVDTSRLARPLGAALEPLRRERAIRRYAGRGLRRRYPSSPDDLRGSELLKAWWYYSIELLPGVVTHGQHPPAMPMLARLMLRRCRVASHTCLDVGTMEGLVPTLLKKRGARDVLAVDYSSHCLGKLAAVQHYHDVDFDYESVGLMYGLGERLSSRSFDLVHVSGLLYHVYSPLTLLAAVRQLVNRNGLLVVSTYVTLDPAPVMDFNAGRMWAEGNTFWFPSVTLLDYLLRYLRLRPVDCLFMPDSELRRPEMAERGHNNDADLGKEYGYLSVVCRAIDRVEGDAWMVESARSSWEYNDLTDWDVVDSRPVSSIDLDPPTNPNGLNLHDVVQQQPPVRWPAARDDSHVLALSATG
jgi:2-polyprenyl-3-methyl-5-hydroxy-6-metoxy-1,4-benzoquinol methylase